MGIAAKLETGRNDDVKVQVNILEAEDGKAGLPAYINEGGRPSRRVRLFLREHEGRKWFEISGPLRKPDGNGGYVMRPRKNDEGQFLDSSNKVVNSESEAAMQYEYLTRRDTGDVVFANIGSINIKNEKTSGEPTKVTLGNLTLVRDQEATEIARKVDQLQGVEKGSDAYKQIEQELSQLRADLPKECKRYHTLFIEDGAEFLRGQGFEVRLGNDQPANNAGNQPAQSAAHSPNF